MKTKKTNPVALITGAAVRLGAATASLLHSNGYNIVIHCNRSTQAGNALATELNSLREDSARVILADLMDQSSVLQLGEKALAAWGRMDVLINNASAFYPTPLKEITDADWDILFASNARAPLFLASICADAIQSNHGCIINISDLYARRGLSNHSIYTMAKAANEAMTKTLARELAPDVRVNGIAPGAILWPPGEELSEEKKQEIIDKASLKKMGSPDDIANAAWFLIEKATYMTGQILHIDGGR